MSTDFFRPRFIRRFGVKTAKSHKRLIERGIMINERNEYFKKRDLARLEKRERRAYIDALTKAVAYDWKLYDEEKKRQRKAIDEIKDPYLRGKLIQIFHTSHGSKLLKNLHESDIKKLDYAQIVAKEAEELKREWKELFRKLKSNFEYFGRAKRLEEIPLLHEWIKQRLIVDKQIWEKMETRRVFRLIFERVDAVVTGKRLAKMVEDKNSFLAELKVKRHESYVKEKHRFEAVLLEEREKRMALRKEERRMERKVLWLKRLKEERSSLKGIQGAQGKKECSGAQGKQTRTRSKKEKKLKNRKGQRNLGVVDQPKH